jgi:hypothetical protein
MVPPGYLVDYREWIFDGSRNETVKNPTCKQLVVYEPHASIVKYLFERFFALRGNLSELVRELKARLYFFPALPKTLDIDPRNRQRITLYRKDGSMQDEVGNYLFRYDALIGILTNPIYLGWWIPIGGGCLEDHHASLVPRYHFDFAYDILSVHDLKGNRQKPQRVKRKYVHYALLSQSLYGVAGSRCYIDCYGDKNEPLYKVCLNKGRYRGHKEYLSKGFEIPVSYLDNAIEPVLEAWIESGLLDDWEEKLESKTNDQEYTRGQIVKSIAECDKRMKRVIDLLVDEGEEEINELEDLDNEEQVAGDLKSALRKRYTALVKKKQEYLDALAKLSESGEQKILETLMKVRDMLPYLREAWYEELDGGERLSVFSAFCTKVIIKEETPGWLSLTIVWAIGSEQAFFVKRAFPARTKATKEEVDAILHLYYDADRETIMKAAPSKSWDRIRQIASHYGLKRNPNYRALATTGPNEGCWLDCEFERAHGLVVSKGKILFCWLIVILI